MSHNDDEGINLLSLDGGGVRGVASLVILHDIMKRIQKKRGLAELPKPCDFFHMIAGTSTGGLIAIMLGRLRMSTEEALREYDECAEKIFSKNNKKRWTFSDRFRATALQTVIETIVEKRGLGELMHDPENPKKGKAFVCVMPSDCIGEPRLARTFPGADGWDRDIKIWQAARATTAASSFFKPQELGSGSKKGLYIDAAIGVNNPIEYLLKEAVEEFGSGRRLGCIVSIGTGTREVQMDRIPTGLRNLARTPKFFVGLIQTLKNTATDGEETHRRLRSRLHRFPDAYFRFNVPKAAEKVGLQEYTKMGELKEMADAYLASRETIKDISRAVNAIGFDSAEHGLTLGHIYNIDKTQVVLSNKKARLMGEPSRFFTGREVILNRLDTFFSARDTGGAPRREFLLYGLGGVGKTQIAYKAAQLLEQRFKYIFYIDGSSDATIDQSYANIAREHGLDEGTSTSTEASKFRAIKWIEALTEEWLMIFDDLLNSNQNGKLPGRGKGNIIYTSRTAEFKRELPAACTFEVTEMDESDAIAFLLKAADIVAPNTAEQAAQDTALAEQIAEEAAQHTALAQQIVSTLGCLPLAIDHAAAYIKTANFTLQEYLDSLHIKQVRLLENPRSGEEKPENSIVHATLELSYDAIVAIGQREGRSYKGRVALAALNVLSLLSLYHHQKFPLETFARAVNERRAWNADVAFPFERITTDPERNLDNLFWMQEDGKCNLVWFSGARLLEQFSLVKVDAMHQTSMHILVHTWARRRMDRTTYLQQSLAAKILLFESIIPSFKVIDRRHLQSIRTHLEACRNRSNVPFKYDPYDGHLSFKLGWSYKAEKDFQNAERYFQRSLEICKFEYGNEHWITINCMSTLGMLYHEMCRLGDAEEMFLLAIERLRWRINESQWVLDKLEQDQAKSSHRKQHIPIRLPLRLKPTMAGPDGTSVGKDGEPELRLDTSGTAGKKMSVDGIINDIYELEGTHDLLHAYLAKVYIEQGRHGLGKKLFLQATKYIEEKLDEDDPEMMALKTEALYLSGNSDYEFWTDRLNYMMDQWENTDAWQYENMYRFLEIFGEVALENHHHDAAYIAYLRAFTEYESMYGLYDRRVIAVLKRLATCQVYRGNLDSAITFSNVCTRRARKTFGEYHADTIEAYLTTSIIMSIRNSESTEESRSYVEAALHRAEVFYGRDHSKTKKIRQRLEEEKRRAEDDPYEGKPIEEIHQSMKEDLKEMAELAGPDCPLVKRLEALVGGTDGDAPTTIAELYKRVEDTYGETDKVTVKFKAQEKQRRALKASQRSTENDAQSCSGNVEEADSSEAGTKESKDEGKGLAALQKLVEYNNGESSTAQAPDTLIPVIITEKVGPGNNNNNNNSYYYDSDDYGNDARTHLKDKKKFKGKGKAEAKEKGKGKQKDLGNVFLTVPTRWGGGRGGMAY
ncbi:hypothetical protein B0T21DRAFT_452709 [Apiosordaria backusii]|uniref:PNPLA domain-containing protein n=1 Tax=Apiosordaria backusii TaxID=314023 RepID=A0AA40B7W2_9PEZI|nr:hypothetical protein B0T21DRAFT_452709 [Apiosordaria backusii]